MKTLYAGLLVFCIVCIFLLGALCWPYTINTWFMYFGKSPAIVWWQGGLLGFVPGLGQLSLPSAVITWLVMLFIK